MIIKSATCLAFAAACLTTIATVPEAHAQPAGWSARQNVIASERYDGLLATNAAFRQGRMRKECGPIKDANLHAQCIASFNQYEPAITSMAPPRRVASSTKSPRHQAPYLGSSTAARHYQSHYGR
jgi:hypothetical protein